MGRNLTSSTISTSKPSIAVVLFDSGVPVLLLLGVNTHAVEKKLVRGFKPRNFDRHIPAWKESYQ